MGDERLKNKEKLWRRTVLKYTGLAIAGIILFGIGAAYAYAERGYPAVGGEVFALFTPLFYWLVSHTIRDALDLFTYNPEMETGSRKEAEQKWHTSKSGTDARAALITKPRKKQ